MIRGLFAALLLLVTCPAWAADARLPDWSGWWMYGISMTSEWAENPPPLLPGRMEQRLASQLNDDDLPDPARYCRPMQFTGFSDGFVGAVEFLFTPGRVTLATELGFLRRIYLDLPVAPRDVPPTNTGLSRGHWEGDTLVVETVGIDPDARYPNRGQGSMRIGKDVHVVERIRLVAADTLEIDVQTSAPEILSRPDHRRRLYKRIPGQRMAREMTVCVERDRAMDPVTGKQRFDMTPPGDLMPPP